MRHPNRAAAGTKAALRRRARREAAATLLLTLPLTAFAQASPFMTGATALDRNVNDCVATSGKGTARSLSNIPTKQGVGYSLIPRIAATRVSVAPRYSIASWPNSRRVSAMASAIGPRGSGIRCGRPLISIARYSSKAENHPLPTR